jgi:hypothetical protein
MKATDPGDISMCIAHHERFNPSNPSWREVRDERQAFKRKRDKRRRKG